MRFPLALAAFLITSPALAVIGGAPVPASDGIAAHLVMLTSPTGFCSGTVVGERLVLTAAHCAEGARLAVLRFGPNRQPVVNEVVERVLHPNYRRADWAARRTAIDLAIVKTAQPIGLGTRRATISQASVPQAGDALRLYGFGPLAEGDGASAGVLRFAPLTVTGRPGTFQVRLTGPAGALGACTGDSGGPVFDGAQAVAGVVSWSTGAGSSRCGALTGTVPVAPHRGWIMDTIRRLGDRE
jgi:hypothetical protein